MKVKFKYYIVFTLAIFIIVTFLIAKGRGGEKRIIEHNLKSFYTGVITAKYKNESGYHFFKILSTQDKKEYEYCSLDGVEEIYSMAGIGDTIKKIENCNVLLLYKKSVPYCFPYYDFVSKDTTYKELFEKACSCNSIK